MPDVPDDIDQMWDMLFEYTGDGHALVNRDVGTGYEVEILRATNKALVGLKMEWF